MNEEPRRCRQGPEHRAVTVPDMIKLFLHVCNTTISPKHANRVKRHTQGSWLDGGLRERGEGRGRFQEVCVIIVRISSRNFTLLQVVPGGGPSSVCNDTK